MASKKWQQENVEKMRSYRKEWYEKNKESEREKAKDRQSIRRKEFKKWFKEFKTTLKCSICGFSHPAALDFHHKDPSTKEFNLGAIGCSVSKEKIIEEIEKCDILCANCHRIHHYQENTSMV